MAKKTKADADLEKFTNELAKTPEEQRNYYQKQVAKRQAEKSVEVMAETQKIFQMVANKELNLYDGSLMVKMLKDIQEMKFKQEEHDSQKTEKVEIPPIQIQLVGGEQSKLEQNTRIEEIEKKIKNEIGFDEKKA